LNLEKTHKGLVVRERNSDNDVSTLYHKTITDNASKTMTQYVGECDTKETREKTEIPQIFKETSVKLTATTVKTTVNGLKDKEKSLCSIQEYHDGQTMSLYSLTLFISLFFSSLLQNNQWT
jgi:hypothetical protein